MSRILGTVRKLVVGRPYWTLGVLLLVTVFLGAGSTLRGEPPTSRANLPQGSAVALALVELEELFGEAAEASVTTVVFRGDVMTPEGLAQIDRLLAQVVTDPEVAPLLVPNDPLFAPSLLVGFALGVTDFGSLTQAEIDATRTLPGIGEALDAATSHDHNGDPIGLATVRLVDTADDRILEAERRIHELALASAGPLVVGTVSVAVIEDEIRRGTEEGMAPLVLLACALIAALVFVFMRSAADLALTLGGLVLSIIWVVGVEGWLGPDGLGITGPPNQLTVLVPIIVIALTVDYSIQIVSHYREQRLDGLSVRDSAEIGLRNVSLPLALAAVTTIVSFLTGLFSPIEVVDDFGVVAGLGVGLSLIVMLTLIPAGRAIIDSRREAKGRMSPPPPISAALPGIGVIAGTLGRSVTRRPTPYIAGVLLVVAGLGWAATGLESEFTVRELLPRGGSIHEDMDSLESAFGGTEERFTILVKGEATEARTLLNFSDLTAAFEDERRRPRAASGPIEGSYELVVRDWVNDSGLPDDKYDPQIASLFEEASAGVDLDPVLMQQVLDRVAAVDPAMSRFLVNDPNGIDAMLLRFPGYGGSSTAARTVQSDLEALWFGPNESITAVSDSIISFTVADAITGQQTSALSTVILSALIVLSIFFWMTVRQPALALIAVGPIGLVLVAVLGTMALLGIPYTLLTSLITALSIGIGVDYTIHMIHRYREEYAHKRDPEQAAIRTLSITGSALLGSALTTGLGIGVLVLSPLEGSRQFAITSAITIFYCLVISVLLVPPAMTLWGAYQNMRLRTRVRNWAAELDEVIGALDKT